VLVAFGHQPDATAADSQALDAQFVAYARDDDVAVVGLDQAVNDEYGTRLNPCAHHRVAGDSHVEGRHGVLDEVAVEVEVALDVALGGRRKPCGDRSHKQGACPLGRAVGTPHRFDIRV